MRDKMYIVFLLVLTIVVFAFVGCSDDDTNTPTGTTSVVPTNMVGVYRQDSAKVNGTLQDIATFFDWSDSTVEARFFLYSGGEQAFHEYDSSSTIVYSDSGYVVMNGNNLTVVLTTEEGTPMATPDTTFVGTYAFSAPTLSLTTSEGADTVLMWWTKLTTE